MDTMRASIRILVLAFSVMVGTSATAQFSAGFVAGFPVGTFSDIAGTGFGAAIQYEEGLKDNLYLSFSLGYLSFIGRDIAVGGNTASLGNSTNVPATVGLQYDFNATGNGIYAVGDLSVNFVSIHNLNVNSGSGGGYNITSSTATKVGFSPGIGYRAGNWDFVGRFNIVSDFNYTSLRIGYVFGNK